LERDVKRQKLTKVKNYSGPPKRKPLSIRYAEILKLREAVAQHDARTVRPKSNEQPSR
jgi:hypothetical protein